MGRMRGRSGRRRVLNGNSGCKGIAEGDAWAGFHGGNAGLISVANTPRLSATPLAVSTAGRGASSEALAFCGGP